MIYSSFVLGVDIGTTGCKTIAVDRAGQILAEGEASYPVLAPRPGWAEQDPDAVRHGVREAVRQCLTRVEGAPRALAFGGALHSLVPLDVHDRPLMPALIWGDTRSATQAAALQARKDAHALYARTGCPAHPMYPLSKILWLRQAAPELWTRAARFVSVKEYVLYEWTHAWRVDESLAVGSGLLNLYTLDWDEQALELARIARERLSPLAPSIERAGEIRPELARDLGLPSGTPLILGASDAALSSLGAGALKPGVFVAMIGSSGAIRTFAPRPRVDERGRTWCYLLDKSHYLVGGAINNAGLVLRWFADNFAGNAGGDAYELLVREAGEVGAGAAGLIFLPFLTGERSPGWNPRARGVLFGLSLHHSRRHVARAILEGVAFRLRSVLEALEEVAGRAATLRVSGGFVHSPLWVQITADVLGRTLDVPSTANTSALGAAWWGWHALGDPSDLSAVVDKIAVTQTVTADPARHTWYDTLYALYCRLYEQSAPSFNAISEIQDLDPQAMR